MKRQHSRTRATLEAKRQHCGGAVRTVSKVIIGKDILELLSSSMYVNPLTIYREYIQNAADAIDDAVEYGYLAGIEDGRIDISLDHIGRRAVVRDNGTGLSGDEFAERMTAFGASAKRGTDARGFRGVGRLAGLGYCQELVFRSRSPQDRSVSEIRWDCRLLKNFLLDPKFDGALGDIVKRVATVRSFTDQDLPERFFEVEIIKPRRIGHDVLLNEQIIEDYIAQVAPVGFHPDFRFGSQIRDCLSDMMSRLDEYSIYINGSDFPVYRPFRDEVAYSDTKISVCDEIEPLQIGSLDGRVAAAGWIMHHDYQGAIPRSQGVRGLRARVGNIQVGDSRIFSDAFPEQRFNSWTIGEVHVLDRRISPNGRRDNFEPNTHLFNLTNHLTPFTHQIARKCRSNSQIRTRLRAFDLAEERVHEILDFIEQGAVSKKLTTEMRKEVGGRLADMLRVAEFDLLGTKKRQKLGRRIKKIEKRAGALSGGANTDGLLSGIPQRKRRVYQEVFDLIYQCSGNRANAKVLIDKIMARISHVDD